MNQIESKKTITREGSIIEALPSLTFKVKLDDENEIIAKLSGKMRLHHIRVLVGDSVRVEISPYDLTRGRIVYRGK